MLSSMSDSLQAFKEKRPQGFIALKTTTPYVDDEYDSGELLNHGLYHAMELTHARIKNINITDAYGVAEGLHKTGLAKYAYYDRVHFRPFVYEQLNDVLLNQLC